MPSDHSGSVAPLIRRTLMVLLLAPLAALVLSSAAAAATFTVNSPSDVALSPSSSNTCPATCTLREAVQAADNTGGQNTIALPGGDYKLTIADTASGQTDDPAVGDLDVNSGVTLTITGAGASSTTVDADNVDRAFAVHSGGSLAISGVTLEHGAQPEPPQPSSDSTNPGYGGAVYNDGAVSIEDSVVSDNSAYSGGSVVYADSAASSTSITNSTVTGNTSNEDGGVLDITSGTVTLAGDTITHNTADSGSVVYQYFTSPHTATTVSIVSSTISDNLAIDDGGALYMQDSGSLSISGSTLAGNSTDEESGGAVYDDNSGPVTIDNSVMSSDDSGSADAGALYVGDSGTLTISSSTFDDDGAGTAGGGEFPEPTDAGAIYVYGTNLVVSSSTFDGDAAGSGGAIYLYGDGTSTKQSITTSTFSGDSATSDEGGAIDEDEGDLSLARSTFTNDSAYYGGALMEYGSAGLLSNDTFDGNQATEGGALEFEEAAASGTLALLNDTITRNTGYDGGGIYDPHNATTTIENTIVAGNSGAASSDGGGDCYGTAATDNAGSSDLGGNIDSDGSCFSPSVARDHTGVNPDLGELADNGGPTETDALLAGSPAIGDAVAASCPASDQRGVPRSGACDSGAFQAADADLALSIAAPKRAAAGSPITYTLTITDEGPAPATGVTLADKLPSGTRLFSSSASQGSCAGTSTITCSLGTLDSTDTATSTSATVTIVLIPYKVGSLKNTAVVSGSVTDPNAANNTASADTSVSAPAGRPAALTGIATHVTSKSAKLSGIIFPAGQSTTYSVQIGTNTRHRKTIRGGRLNGSSPKSVLITVKRLKPGKTYHFRIVASNASGTGVGQQVTFKTK